MDIEKYYWEAKDENEARVITAILAKFFDNKHGLRGIYSASTLYYFIANEGCLDVSSCREDLPSMSKRSTIPDLLEMALRGFKERWEVAPEGYRLVTEEERKKYPKPNIGMMHTEINWDGEWYVDSGHYLWRTSGFFFAVPLDFTFEP